ncbi:hypothetical protein DNH61_10135 [Paenibacillus sambharensis]|uniref:Uncharacterized protein n=1 Tax=Paenibacillus sambharensis TaxID=1803190 RepID=A0A2W1LMY4_9BACL|nr:hypothetical protein [Paenibacillus sambharensis]PZD95804.1 hypothetical protein DNH61_10135 [Paenibacillus sambharensis]
MRERYYTTVEHIDRYGRTIKEFTVYAELGKKPTIGDFTEAFRKAGLDVDISDFISMTFKPRKPENTPLKSLRIIRTLHDHTYNSSKSTKAIV